MMPGDQSQMLPSTPMTGPMSPSPAKRKLPTEETPLTPEAQLQATLSGEDYVIPARPSTLRMESEEPTMALQLSRRHLNSGFGPRRL